MRAEIGVGSERTAILHIGPMKTGSSSIQFWLQRNAEAFRGSGFATSLGVGERNRSWLAHVAGRIARGEELSPDIAGWLAKLLHGLAGLPASVHTVVLSGEMMGQVLLTADGVAALKQLLDPYFGSYRIVTYLRRQDQLSVSRFSTALRQGERRARPLVKVVDLEAMLAAWEQVFGREAMCVRLFDRAELVGGDVVQDFAAVAGLPPIAFDDQAVGRNASLRPEAQRLLAELAARLELAGHSGSFADLAGMEIVNRVLDQRFSGRGIMPSRSEVTAYYARYRDPNDRIRRAWFPQRDRLFSEDFSDYPEESSAEPSGDALLEPALVALTGLLLGSARAATGGHSRERRQAERRARRTAGKG